MSFSKKIIKDVVAVTLIMSIGLTACLQKNSIDNRSVETPSIETSNDEDDRIEISMEDVISMGKDEAAKYYMEM